MKKSFLKLGLLTAGLTALAIPTALSITSCSTSNKFPSINANERYNLVQNAYWTNPSTSGTGGKFFINEEGIAEAAQNALVLDPNLNEDAINKIRNTFKRRLIDDTNGIKTLQEDFDKILTNFFKAYEFELEEGKRIFFDGDKDKNEQEIESEINKVTVKKIYKDYGAVEKGVGTNNQLKPAESDANKKYMYALVNVEYEVTTKKNDIEITENVTQEKLFTIKPTFSTESQIYSTIRKLYNSMKNDTNLGTGNNTLEAEHLFELYYGDIEYDYDNDKDKDFDFDEIELGKNTRDDSIFKQFSSNVHNGIGGLIGYSLDLNDLNYTLNLTRDGSNPQEPTVNIKEFYAPSYSIREIFVPQQQEIKPSNPSDGKPSQNLDFSLNLSKLESIKYSELKTRLEGTKTEPNTTGNIDFFSSLLKDKYTQDEIKRLTQSIHVQEINVGNSNGQPGVGGKDNLLGEKAIEVIVQLKDENPLGAGMPKIISIVIQESWCNQDQQPAPPANGEK